MSKPPFRVFLTEAQAARFAEPMECESVVYVCFDEYTRVCDLLDQKGGDLMGCKGKKGKKGKGRGY